jgi:DNA-binding protein HU-beta
MNKKNLIEILSHKAKLTKKESEEIVTIILESIIQAVSRGEKVTLVGFGSFTLRKRKAREVRNPRTGTKLCVPEVKLPVFSVGKFFKNSVNSSSL